MRLWMTGWLGFFLLITLAAGSTAYAQEPECLSVDELGMCADDAEAPGDPPVVTRPRFSGMMGGNRTWSGEVLITGDVFIGGNLTIEPGTVVRFEIGDDREMGGEVPPDGFNDRDPTRLEAYARSHAQLVVMGRLVAHGTEEAPILFTSASDAPRIADWQGINFRTDGSLIEYAVLEYSRNGFAPTNPHPNSLITHSVIRHTLWGCVSSGESGIQVIENEIYECGHEGVDVKDGNTVVRGNRIYDSHAGVVVLGGHPLIEGNVITNVGDGIGGRGIAGALVRENSVNLAPRNSTKEWRYEGFAYPMFGPPR